MTRTWDGKLFSLINETSECKLQRARDVPSRIALFAPIALSNFVIGVDETSYSRRELRRQVAPPRKLPNRDRRLLLWISWRAHKNLIDWIYTSVDLTNNHAAIELWYLVPRFIKRNSRRGLHWTQIISPTFHFMRFKKNFTEWASQLKRGFFVSTAH